MLFSCVHAQDQPNIIFILADDLGYGDLSCYGAKDLQTPNIDALAQQAITFTRAYANSTVCSPSRASILTGNYPDLVGVPGVIRDMQDNTWGNLRDDITTLPEELQKLNYNTALIGKWHLGYKSPDLPNDRGFDYFKGFVGDMMDDYYTHRKAGVNWMRENNQVINPKGHATDLFTDWTLEYLREQNKQEKPFFLFLTYNAPHDPVQPPQEWLSKIQNKEQNSTLKRQKMIAFVEHLDYNVGRILDQLNNSDLGENTIVVFTSDNGGALQYGASNNPFTGGKGDFFEGGIRVPFVIAGPQILAGLESKTPITHSDLLPTIIDLAGLKLPLQDDLDGGSFKAILANKGKGNVSRFSEGLIFHVPYKNGIALKRAHSAIIIDNFKLIKFYDNGELMLFNLNEDLEEKNNLALSLPNKVHTLEKALDTYLSKVKAPKWKPGITWKDKPIEKINSYH